MTTYSEVEAACHAYNAAAGRCGRDQFTRHFIAEQCGVPLEFFSAQCGAALSSDLEALAAEVLRELKDETAAMLSGRGNGVGGPGPEPENRPFDDLIAAAGDLAEGDIEGARRLINEAAESGFDNLDASELIRAIRASTKLLKPALDGAWKRAVKQIEDEAARAAVQRAIEEAQARAEREQAEAAALREQRAEQVAPLAKDPNLLGRVITAVHRLGVVREEVGIKAVYLTFTSRLLKRRVISLIRRGTASSGKNHLIEQVLALFPPGSIIRMTGSSAKVMPYWGGDDPDFLKHKALYVPEASSLLARDGKETEQAGMIRSAISENRIDYPVVVLQGNGLPPITRQIVKHGPIVFVVTSARNNVEPEMNSRLAPADADESIAQSSMVMTYAFDGAGGLLDPTAAEEAEVELLRDFQLWLEDGGPYDVVVPFAPHVRAAFSRTPIAVRIRRDINILIAGTAASAILHKAQREIDARGRIIATLDDYSHAWLAFNPGVSAFHHPQQAPGVIALVRVLEGMIEKGRAAKAAADDYRLRDNPDVWSPEDASFDGSVKATARQLAAMLGLASMDTISSRLGDAKAAGAIECVNESDPHNITRRYKVKISSEDLAKEGAIAVFPTPAEVVRLTKDPVAYERAREAIRAEGASAPTPTPYDPDDVPF